MLCKSCREGKHCDGLGFRHRGRCQVMVLDKMIFRKDKFYRCRCNEKEKK